jgi:hypothetical protein
MRPQSDLSCKPAQWHGRQAFALENDLIRLITLAGGGHIAEFQFRDGAGHPTLNPLWVPPWKTIEPYRYRERDHAAVYGPPPTGKMISGIAGHNICLDYFGAPSEEEARQGLSIHGEAPSLRWRKVRARASRQEVALELEVRLPVAGLRFRREIKLRRNETVAYFREVTVNETKADHFCHWIQHVTLGPPFLAPGHSRVFISGTRGRTFPHGYEGKALLESSRDFRWPLAPSAAGASVDLGQPFIRTGLGFVATVLLNPRRDQEYVAALNTEDHLLLGYCFDRRDFPWTAVWEENKARTEAPWSKKTQARGLEFGSTPFPVGRREALANGPLFGAPHFTVIPARCSKTVCYASFLAAVPPGFSVVDDIRCAAGEIVIKGRGGGESGATVRLPAGGLLPVD